MTAKTPKSRRKAAAPKAPRTAQAAKPEAAATPGELLDMDQAIALLKTTRPTFYRWLRAGKIKAMKAGRQWRFYRTDVERFLKGEEPRIEVTGDIAGLLDALASKMRAAGLDPKRDAGGVQGDGSQEAIDRLFRLALAGRASDIHLQPPGTPEGHATLRLRIDGVLHELVSFDGRLVAPLVERLKIMAACDVQQKRRTQDGRIRINLNGEDLDLRVNFLPALFGEAVTLRLLRREALTFRLDDLPYSPRDMGRIRQALALPWGMVIITGPTGSGKTTTLYAAMQEFNKPGVKLMSVEDPVEYAFQGVVQVPVNVREGVSFASVLRSFLRSDPDVIMIGELRDNEALQIAVQAALTGHRVLTSLHTDDAPAALVRLTDIGLDAFLVDAVKMVIGQRLIRSLCKQCSEPVELNAEQAAMAATIAREGGLDWGTLPRGFRKAVGCKACNFTGYRGRTLAAETLLVTPEITDALRNKAGVAAMRRIAVEQGMTTMIADAVARAAAGETTLQEALGNCGCRSGA